MLNGIDPLLTGDILLSLDSLGHNDRLLVADGNFPIRALPSNVEVHSIGAPTLPALQAILTVVPLEDSERDAIVVRRASEDNTLDDLQNSVLAMTHGYGYSSFSCPPREDFRILVQKARVVIKTTDFGPSCFLLRKGVVESGQQKPVNHANRHPRLMP